MGELLLKAAKPILLEYLEKIRKAAPAAILAAIAAVVAYLPTTIDKAAALFRQVYSDLVGRVGAWLPTTAAPLTTTAGKLTDKAKGLIAKL